MMTNTEFDLWAIRAGISDAAKAYIQRVRTSPPSRKPENRHGSNVIGAYPSRKMGLAINFESHKCELPAIHLHEHNAAILEYWEQPEAIKLYYEGRNGKPDSFLYTPDFMVLRRGSAVLQEWKYEKDLVAQAVKSPNRYVKREDGGWSCPPAEAAAAEMGLTFEVHSDREINWSLQRNFTFLEDYFRKSYPVSVEITDKISEIVTLNPGILLSELKGLAKNAGACADDIFSLIVSETIYVDLAAAPLAEPEHVRVFATREIGDAYVSVETEPREEGPTATSLIRLKPGSALSWNGVPLRVQVVGETKVALTDRDGKALELSIESIRALLKDGDIAAAPDVEAEDVAKRERALDVIAKARPEDLAEATRRWEIIKSRLNPDARAGTAVPFDCKPATFYRWLKDYREAKALCGYGYIGLIPKPRQGNGDPRIPSEVQEAVDANIAAHYKQPKKLRTSIIYRALRDFCKSKNLPCPSRKTVTIKLKSFSAYDREKVQGGKRKAYQVKEFYYELTYTTPRHGERPFEIGHIDHTPADAQINCSHTDQPLGRPYMTFLTDAFCRRILAVYLSFEEPSYRACMAVLRICVQRHNRLPRIIVIDNGPEFRSTYFEALLAMFECTRKVRPRAQPRAGNPVENLFNITNVQFIHALRGNTLATKDVRTTTKSHDPKKVAVWTLPPFYEQLCNYAYEVYDTCPHGTLHQSPRDACAAGLENSGDRAHQFIAYDEAFKMMTLPTTPRKKAQIIPRYGIKIHGIYYWNDDFRRASLHRKLVEVRYEPFDISTAYALVNGSWIACRSEALGVFRNMSEKMLMLVMRTRRQLAKQHGRDVETISGPKLAEFYKTIEKTEAILTQKKRDIESEAALRREGAEKPAGANESSVRDNAVPQDTVSRTTDDRPEATDRPQVTFTAEVDEDDYEDFVS